MLLILVYIFYALVIANILQTIIISFVKKQNVIAIDKNMKIPDTLPSIRVNFLPFKSAR